MPSRVVLITGCSSGIGRATAVHLARTGWRVYATARRPSSIADLEGKGCRILQLDVTDETSMREAVATVEAEHGSVGALINNAGYSQSGAVEAVPLDRVREQFETNVFGPARLLQLVLPAMRAHHSGRIVNVSSMGGRLVLPGGGYYHASKYALEALSDALRFEVAGFGIQVCLIEPGLVRSSFGEVASRSLDRGPNANDAYAHFHAEVARITRESYERGALAPLASSPEDVAKTIERALTSPRPRARYVVSPSARFLLTLRRILPDRAWDAFMARTYPRPGAASENHVPIRT